ncbi:MAG TPA: preprotein translocase subunit SecE [Candidatus Paceibacterota bacterium]|nr:preprotein translocase subunit SecE [Candidatus Paceibacterota bacterium]
MFTRIRLFLAESQEEFKRINWPNRDQATKMVIVVIVISVFTAAFLGALDYIFIAILEKALKI